MACGTVVVGEVSYFVHGRVCVCVCIISFYVIIHFLNLVLVDSGLIYGRGVSFFMYSGGWGGGGGGVKLLKL